MSAVTKYVPGGRDDAEPGVGEAGAQAVALLAQVVGDAAVEVVAEREAGRSRAGTVRR